MSLPLIRVAGAARGAMARAARRRNRVFTLVSGWAWWLGVRRDA
jgi:hypothetical protein